MLSLSLAAILIHPSMSSICCTALRAMTPPRFASNKKFSVSLYLPTPRRYIGAVPPPPRRVVLHPLQLCLELHLIIYIYIYMPLTYMDFYISFLSLCLSFFISPFWLDIGVWM
ncbi:hypothetical protein C8J57DRAFT_374794 [Mycena rebaudengoi]|nr:hypothetical protein C8J57DRAFT_374794 [Mycena rebaudengoi]